VRNRHPRPADRVTRWAARLLVVLLVLALPAIASATARAEPPLGKYGATLSFRLSGVQPLVVTASNGTTLTVTGRYTNTSKSTITELGYKFQRGDVMTSTSAIRKQVSDPTQQFAVVNEGFRTLPGTLKAGASADFAASVPLTGSAAKSLAITRPGVYPVMININATLHLKDETVRARVGELHLMVTVLSVPGSDPGGTTIPGGSAAGTPGIPLSMLWPLVDTPHLGVNGVFTDDTLATEIKPGGRLADLVDTLQNSRAGPAVITLVIDPMLLDELDRMSRGYWVVAKPGTPQPPLTPTVNASAAPASTQPTSSQPTSTGVPSSTEGNTASGAATGSPSAPAASSGVTDTSGTGGTGTTGAPSSAAVTNPSGSATAGTQAHTGTLDATTSSSGESVDPAASGGSESGTSSLAMDLPGRTGQVHSGSDGQPGTTDGGATTSANTGADPSVTATGASGRGSSAGSTSAPSTGAADDTTSTPTTPGTTTPTTPSTTPGTGATTEPPSTTETGPIPAPTPQPSDTVAGTGARAAAAFLDRLRELAITHQVLVLPYGDPDVVALVRAGMTDELATAVYRGRAVASRVLQQPASTVDTSSHLITTVAFPPAGLLDEPTLQALRALGYTSAVLSTEGVAEKSATPMGVVPLATDRGSIPALVSDATLVSDIGTFVYHELPADWADRVNLLAALMAQQHFDKTGTPMVLVPDRDWSPDRSGFTLITGLLQVMGNEGVLTGTSLAGLAATDTSGSATATLRYPDRAQRQELPADYLDSLEDMQNQISVLGEALTANPGPEGADPADILGPLQEAMLGAVSSSWRGDPDPDGPVLQTVSSTIAALYDGVRIRRGSGSYTLASSTSPLLLTVQNTLPYQVTVTVGILGGGPVGLLAHDPGRIVIAGGPRTKQITIDTEVSRSGTFTVYAQLRGPSGATWGVAVPLTIASRAYGVLTLVLMLVAGGILVLMVVFRIHQRWRARQRRLADEAAGGGASAAIAAGGTNILDDNGGDEPGGGP